MRVSSLLLALSFTYVASSVAAEALVSRGSSNSGSGGGATFVTVPYTTGGQTLFSSNIINVNVNAVNNQNYLSGNNAGPAPQGGVGSRQGGLGFGRVAGGFNFGKGAADFSGTNSANSGSSSSSFSSNGSFQNTTNNGLSTGNSSQGGLSSAGTSSLNLNGGTSSAGFSSQNFNNGSSSAGSITFNNGSSSLNNTSGSSSVGFNSANNTNGSSSVGFNSANNVFNGTSNVSTNGLNSQNTAALQGFNTPGGTKPVLLITSLIDSTNPVSGSAGAFFQGVQGTTINTITFQYGSLPTATNQVSTTGNQAPYLVIDDQAAGTSNQARFLPVSAGTISRSNNNLGLTTVTFNTNQLQLRGQVQRVGIAFFRKGSVVIDNVAINGSPSTGIIAQASDVYPF